MSNKVTDLPPIYCTSLSWSEGDDAGVFRVAFGNSDGKTFEAWYFHGALSDRCVASLHKALGDHLEARRAVGVSVEPSPVLN